MLSQAFDVVARRAEDGTGAARETSVPVHIIKAIEKTSLKDKIKFRIEDDCLVCEPADGKVFGNHFHIHGINNLGDDEKTVIADLAARTFKQGVRSMAPLSELIVPDNSPWSFSTLFNNQLYSNYRKLTYLTRYIKYQNAELVDQLYQSATSGEGWMSAITAAYGALRGEKWWYPFIFSNEPAADITAAAAELTTPFFWNRPKNQAVLKPDLEATMPHIEVAADKVLLRVKRLYERYGCVPDTTTISGFSQGGGLAAIIALNRMPDMFAHLFMIASPYVKTSNSPPVLSTKTNLTVILIKNDPVPRLSGCSHEQIMEAMKDFPARARLLEVDHNATHIKDTHALKDEAARMLGRCIIGAIKRRLAKQRLSAHHTEATAPKAQPAIQPTVLAA